MRLERVGAAGGLVFVLLNLATIPLTGSLPAPDASAQDIAEWLDDNASGIQASVFLTGLAAFALVWWFGSLWRKTSAAEHGETYLSVIALSGLILSGVMYMLNGVILSGMAMRQDEGGSAPVLWAMSGIAPSLGAVGVALLVSSISALAWRTKMLPAWLVYLGGLVAVVELVASLGAASDASAFFVVAIAGFLGWAVWILAISWDLWQRPAPTG